MCVHLFYLINVSYYGTHILNVNYVEQSPAVEVPVHGPLEQLVALEGCAARRPCDNRIREYDLSDDTKPPLWCYVSTFLWRIIADIADIAHCLTVIFTILTFLPNLPEGISEPSIESSKNVLAWLSGELCKSLSVALRCCFPFWKCLSNRQVTSGNQYLTKGPNVKIICSSTSRATCNHTLLLRRSPEPHSKDRSSDLKNQDL